MENTETFIFRYCWRVRLISKIFIKMKVSLGVPLVYLCLVTITTQLSKITQFVFITNVFWKSNFTTESMFWYQVNRKIGPLNNCEPQIPWYRMIPWVPLSHCCTFSVDIVKDFILNIKFLTFHFSEAMQHNFVFKYLGYFPRRAPSWIFDRIANVIESINLCETKLSTTWFT